jgi:hypothetical protein
MLSVYFDTNVYDRIDKRGIPSADLEALRLAFNDGRLVGHLGIRVIEELVGQWEQTVWLWFANLSWYTI